MSNTTDGDMPKEKVSRETFCVRFNGDEKTRLSQVAKDAGKSLNNFVREAALEKAGIQPSR